ncbi:MAG: hypothetical protein IKZ51_04780 [Bacteroidales bacterium]|nr:hypothetical protein [Bacteroidales bacterium]
MKKLLFTLSLALILMPSMAREHKDFKYDDFESLDKGFWFALQASGSPAFCGNSSQAFYGQVDFITGYRVSEFFKFGIGFSPRMVFTYSKYSMGFPPGWLSKDLDILAYLDLRGNFASQRTRKAVPYWNIDLGYKPLYGAFASPTLGYRFGGPRKNFLVGVTYTYQHIFGELNLPVHSAGLKLGFEF